MSNRVPTNSTVPYFQPCGRVGVLMGELVMRPPVSGDAPWSDERRAVVVTLAA